MGAVLSPSKSLVVDEERMRYKCDFPRVGSALLFFHCFDTVGWLSVLIFKVLFWYKWRKKPRKKQRS